MSKKKLSRIYFNNIFIIDLEASNAMVSLKLLAILVPFQSGSWVAVCLTSKLYSLAGWDGVKLFLHFFWMSPLWGHSYRRRQKSLLADECVFAKTFCRNYYIIFSHPKNRFLNYTVTVLSSSGWLMTPGFFK